MSGYRARIGWLERLERQDDVAPGIVEAIRAHQDRSERLIGWVQLAIVSAFAVLFTLAPKPLPEPIWERAALWILVAYGAFTLIRLVLSYRMRLPPWVLGASIVADMGLLIGLIFSFHIEYQQPASFSLKAPTLLYVFIFIAIRALRFEARYVLLAGLTAAAGWGAMVLYVLSGSDADMIITRNYVTYLTSNSILLGAEFDKIISILVVTGLLTAAIVRARGMLIRSARERSAASALSRFFSPEIAGRIRASGDAIHAGQGVARDAAILTTDIRGFTRLAQELDPADVTRLLTSYQAVVVPIVQRHGGVIDKFLGDGILATFGAAEPSESAAADALAAGLEILSAADAWAAGAPDAGLPPVTVSVAVTYGRVVFGAVGDETRLEYTVIGDPVNLAAKLDKHGKQLGARLITTRQTLLEASRGGGNLPAPARVLPAVAVDGTDAPVDIVVMRDGSR